MFSKIEDKARILWWAEFGDGLKIATPEFECLT